MIEVVAVPHCSNCGTQELVDQKFCSACGTPTSLAPGAETPLPYYPMHSPGPTAIVHLASFWWRALGYVIDLVFLLAVIAFPLKGLHLTYYSSVILNLLAAYFYAALFIGLVGGQTIGMKIVGIRCVNASDQSKVTLHQAFLRATAYGALVLVGSFYRVHRYLDPTALQTKEYAKQVFIYYCFLAPHFLDLLWAAWDKKNQTLHDKFAKTVVVRRPRTVA